MRLKERNGRRKISRGQENGSQVGQRAALTALPVPGDKSPLLGSRRPEHGGSAQVKCPGRGSGSLPLLPASCLVLGRLHSLSGFRCPGRSAQTMMGWLVHTKPTADPAQSRVLHTWWVVLPCGAMAAVLAGTAARSQGCVQC